MSYDPHRCDCKTDNHCGIHNPPARVFYYDQEEDS